MPPRKKGKQSQGGQRGRPRKNQPAAIIHVHAVAPEPEPAVVAAPAAPEKKKREPRDETVARNALFATRIGDMKTMLGGRSMYPIAVMNRMPMEQAEKLREHHMLFPVAGPQSIGLAKNKKAEFKRAVARSLQGNQGARRALLTVSRDNISANRDFGKFLTFGFKRKAYSQADLKTMRAAGKGENWGMTRSEAIKAHRGMFSAKRIIKPEHAEKRRRTLAAYRAKVAAAKLAAANAANIPPASSAVGALLARSRQR